jgi:hypothetical protein
LEKHSSRLWEGQHLPDGRQGVAKFGSRSTRLCHSSRTQRQRASRRTGDMSKLRLRCSPPGMLLLRKTAGERLGLHLLSRRGQPKPLRPSVVDGGSSTMRL